MLSKEAKREYQREYMRKRRAREKTAKDNGQEHFIDSLTWKPIPGCPGYSASKSGLILSEHRTMVRSNGRNHTIPARVLKQFKDSKGYYQVGLYRDKKNTNYLVHKAIYTAWNGEIPDGLVIDHIDADKLNNCADNLQLLSCSQNVLKGWTDAKKDAFDKGYAAAKRAEYDKGFKAGLKAGLAWEPGESVYTWS